MTKRPGHPCPTCNDIPCAEFTMKDQPPSWKCNGCGSGGELASTSVAKPVPQPTVHKNPGRVC